MIGFEKLLKPEMYAVPGENPHKHKDNMQTPHGKTPGPTRGLNPGRPCCEATV